MATENAATIRKELKKAGYNSRQVSVRNHSYSMGSSVYVTINDPEADFELIESIAMSQRSVHWCEHTQEILSGGNRFVDVKWSDSAKEVIAKEVEYLSELVTRENFKDMEEGFGLTIGCFTFYKTFDHYNFNVTVEGDWTLKYLYLDKKLETGSLFQLAMMKRKYDQQQIALIGA